MVLVLLIGFGLVIYIRNIDEVDVEIKKSLEISIDVNPVTSFVDDCIQKATTEAANLLGLQGGYYVAPEKNIDMISAEVPFYYFDGSNLIPTKERIENEFAVAVNDNLDSCIDFSSFEDQGYDIKFGNIETKVKLTKEDVLVSIKWPLTIKIKDTIHKISDFSYTVPVRLDHIYEISNELVNKIVEEPYYVDLTFLLSQDLDISVVDYDDCTDIYVIFDNNSKSIPDSIYTFLFAAKIDDKYCKLGIESTGEVSLEVIENKPPVLDLIDYSIAKVNEPFAYKVTASDPENDNLFFLDDTDLFFINPVTGIIGFTPIPGQEGEYKINITVTDVNGKIDSEWFYLEIK